MFSSIYPKNKNSNLNNQISPTTRELLHSSLQSSIFKWTTQKQGQLKNNQQPNFYVVANNKQLKC